MVVPHRFPIRDKRSRAWRILLMLLLAGIFFPAVAATAAIPPQAPNVKPQPQREFTNTGALWWTWAVAQPIATNPLTDTTGQFCDRGQSGPTWFLGGIFSLIPTGAVIRECTVPTGKTLVFPVLNDVEGDLPTETKTVEQLRAAAAANIALATDMIVTVDGKKLPASDLQFEESRVFSLTLPADNIFSVPGPVVVNPTVDAGYYVHLHPFSRGQHTVRIQGAAGTFALDVTYKLTIGKP